MSQSGRQFRKLASAVLIVVLSAALGILVDWRAPGFSRYASDWLVRERGPLPVPPEIAIVAIDEKSIAAFGRFPWPRAVIAKAIGELSKSGPKVIAVDVLFADPTNDENDEALIHSVAAAGNVVVAAQLVDSPFHGGPASWLMPMPALAKAAAGVGHVNVQVESEGTARQLAVQESDDAGTTLRAIAVETVRVGDRTPEQGVTFTGRALLVGDRLIPVEAPASSVIFSPGAARLQTGRMTIDYVGPAGSFEPVTYSLVDVVNGAVPAGRFRGKYVLIGSTAASQADRLASPFLHQTDARADQHGVLMPGVEVLANGLATVLHSRFYAESSDWSAFLWAALIAVLTLAALDRAQGPPEFLREAGALILVGGAILTAAYFEFNRLMIFPPIVQALISFVTAGICGLLARSLAASSQLDRSIEQLSQSSELLMPPSATFRGEQAWLPHGLEWKVAKASELNARLIERARFIDQALKSVEDGLLIAAPDGVITFANRSAATILQSTPEALTGQNLFARLHLADEGLPRRLVADRARMEREIEIRDSRTHRYVLGMAAVPGETGVSGIVASLSDVTRQHELQQTKNDVITLVSHEMRTPLTAIQGMTELLAQYEMDSVRRKEISSAINSEAKRLTYMITEYLDITRLESGATVLRKVPAKVDAMLTRTVLLLRPVAALRGIQIIFKPVTGLPPLFADVDLLGRALENLVSNAIKYSPDNTTVTIGARHDDDAVAIAVADEGYGIPESDLARVFDKFYRVPRVEDAGVPGTGLGLAFVREIAELHGGSVGVSSAVHRGSTFTLRLPVSTLET